LQEDSIQLNPEKLNMDFPYRPFADSDKKPNSEHRLKLQFFYVKGKIAGFGYLSL
jgi:hypothetical protein